MAAEAKPCEATVKSDDSADGLIKHSDWRTPSTSPSHCSAYCAASATSVRLRNPSSSRIRANICERASSTATTRPALPFALAARLRSGAPATASSPDGRGATLELCPEGGVFGNDFLIGLGFQSRPACGRRGRDRFRVLQIGVDRRHDDPRLYGDEIDADQ